jgi:hypothetical protein
MGIRFNFHFEKIKNTNFGYIGYKINPFQQIFCKNPESRLKNKA